MSEPKVQRWECETEEFGDSDMQKNNIGNYVRYEDYARLKAEVERLTKAGDNMERAIQANGCDDNGDWDDNEDAMAKWNAAKEGKQS